MKSIGVFLALLMVQQSLVAQSLLTPFERDSLQSATVAECNHFYHTLAAKYPRLRVDKKLGPRFTSIGKSDAGFDIMAFGLNEDLGKAPSKRKTILINNAIHPGEPEGVDASMMLARDILHNQEAWAVLLKSFRICIIAQYNVDGAMRRNCCSRANQNGPEEYGFRANALNLDLNRDFIKLDSRSAQTFVRYFMAIRPDFIVDNHTSNGADYQHTLTYFPSHTAKLAPHLQHWWRASQPSFDSALVARGWIPAPYVETRRDIPDSGIAGFFDGARYATGFAALHNCMGFTVETHMLKPFPRRVHATYAFLQELLSLLQNQQINTGGSAHPLAAQTEISRWYPIRWQLNEARHDSVHFHGYEARYITSEVTGHRRLFYDRSKPWVRRIPFYGNYHATDSVRIPAYYILPQSWTAVAERLRLNGIALRPLMKDTLLLLHVAYIRNYETGRSPYEGHYLHFNTRIRDTLMPIQLLQGDFVIEVNANNARFLAEVLSPGAADSYFNWNFFDAVLQQKEWFSSYVFEDVAAELLRSDGKLRQDFEAMRRRYPAFASDAFAQLYWIYIRSPHYESTHNQYPVFHTFNPLPSSLWKQRGIAKTKP